MLGGCNLSGLQCSQDGGTLSVQAQHNWLFFEEFMSEFPLPPEFFTGVGVAFAVGSQPGWSPTTANYTYTQGGSGLPAANLTPTTDLESFFSELDEVIFECEFGNPLLDEGNPFYYVSPANSLSFLNADTGNLSFQVNGASAPPNQLTMGIAIYFLIEEEVDDEVFSGAFVLCLPPDMDETPVEFTSIMSTSCGLMATAVPFLGPFGLGLLSLLLALTAGASLRRAPRS